MAGVDTEFFPMPGMHACIQRFEKMFQALPSQSHLKSHILIYGPRGSGKSYFIQEIRKKFESRHTVEEINCATIPPDLAASELFGHAKGSFTDAKSSRAGILGKLKDGDVLILNELNSVKDEIHAKLLVFLESSVFHKVGESEKKTLEARVVAAMNDEGGGEVRKDLIDRFYLRIDVPPLHLRRDDIFYYIGRKHKDLIIPMPTLLMLYDHCWPGNFRELERVLTEMSVSLSWSEELSYYNSMFPYWDIFDAKLTSAIKFTEELPAKSSALNYSAKIRLSDSLVRRSSEFWDAYSQQNVIHLLSDYELPEIVLLESNDEEVGSLSLNAIKGLFVSTFNKNSVYSEKPIHLSVPRTIGESGSTDYTPSGIAEYIINTDGSFPRILGEIVAKEGHGGQAHLAKILDVTRSTITNWIKKGRIQLPSKS